MAFSFHRNWNDRSRFTTCPNPGPYVNGRWSFDSPGRQCRVSPPQFLSQVSCSCTFANVTFFVDAIATPLLPPQLCARLALSLLQLIMYSLDSTLDTQLYLICTRFVLSFSCKTSVSTFFFWDPNVLHSPFSPLVVKLYQKSILKTATHLILFRSYRNGVPHRTGTYPLDKLQSSSCYHDLYLPHHYSGFPRRSYPGVHSQSGKKNLAMFTDTGELVDTNVQPDRSQQGGCRAFKQFVWVFVKGI